MFQASVCLINTKLFFDGRWFCRNVKASDVTWMSEASLGIQSP